MRIFLAECAYLRPHHPAPPPEFELFQVLAIEQDITQALFSIRSVRNTFAPINKLHPELLAYITTSVNYPFGGTDDCVDLPFFCAKVCRYWRNSLLAFPGVWSSVDTANSRHMKLHLARSKKMPLHVQYGLETPPGVFEQHIIPERHRLRSLSIPLGYRSHLEVVKSLAEPSESLETLDMWMTRDIFSVSAHTMKAISRFAPNITVLTLYDVAENLPSLEFPALVKLTLRLAYDDCQSLDPEDLIKFLKNSPVLEELDLRLPFLWTKSPPVTTAEFTRLKSAVFDEYSLRQGAYSCVPGLQYLILPKQSITIDVRMSVYIAPSDPLPLLSAINLGGAIFPRQSITAAAIHIKDNPNGFFGHVGICGEYDNWIGLNYVLPPSLREAFLRRLPRWFDPVGLTPLRGIQTLALGFFELTFDEEGCIEALRTFLQELDQVRVLNVYMMNVSLLARILQPYGGVVPLPSLEELKIHTYNPPELIRYATHDEGKWNVVMFKR